MSNKAHFKLSIIVLMINIFQSIATSFTDLLFQHNTMEDFNGVNMNIGWIQFASCKEGCSKCDSGDHSLKYPAEWTKQEMIELSQYAITVKILPSGDVPGAETTEYALTADVCSNPIYALNNGYELSYALDLSTSLISGFADLNDWIGSSNAKNRLENSCYYGDSDDSLPIGSASKLISDGYFYFACNTGAGLHITNDNDNILCEYDYSDTVGHDITIWVGFDASKTAICEIVSPLNYTLSTAPAATTEEPTDLPTNHPSLAPINTITALPTDSSSKFPSTAVPSSNPSSVHVAKPSLNVVDDVITAHVYTPSVAPSGLFPGSLFNTTAEYESTDAGDRVEDNPSSVPVVAPSFTIYIVIILAVLIPFVCVVICVLTALFMKERTKKSHMEMMHDESVIAEAPVSAHNDDVRQKPTLHPNLVPTASEVIDNAETPQQCYDDGEEEAAEGNQLGEGLPMPNNAALERVFATNQIEEEDSFEVIGDDETPMDNDHDMLDGVVTVKGDEEEANEKDDNDILHAVNQTRF